VKEKIYIDDFSIAGGSPALEEKLPVGQLYWPSWEEYVSHFKAIFDREYFTNQGPLVQELEEKLQKYLGVKHVICVVNATIGLAMTLEALGLQGKVIVPSFTFIASAQAISWAGLTPVFCDVNSETHMIDIESIEKVIDKDVSAILPVNLWGGTNDLDLLQDYACKRNLGLVFDSAHSFGVEYKGQSIGGWGDAEVFSFHATKIFTSGEGGCITTNNDLLASKLRNIRSSYGAGKPIEVVKTSNGRMSEAQACIGLINLTKVDDYIDKNKAIYNRYRSAISVIDGLKIIEPSGTTRSNYQYINIEVDEDVFELDRDELIQVLAAENIDARRYFFPGAHNAEPYKKLMQNLDFPNTNYLNKRLLQLPTGSLVTQEIQEIVCTLISSISKFRSELKLKVQA